MKKLLVIMLTLLYGLSSTGMTLHLHYCCGKLDKIDFTPVKETHCGAGHKMGKKSCCDNKQVSLQLQADQNPAKFLSPGFQLPAIKAVQAELLLSGPIATKSVLPEVFAPPPLQKDINTLFCIYRI